MRRGLVLSCLVSVACWTAASRAAEPAGILLAKYRWDASPEAWEPAANPAIQIAGHAISRDEHRWAAFAGKVSFECRLIGDAVWAVNPLPEEDAPKRTPKAWDSAELLNLLGGPLGDVEITNGKIQRADWEIDPLYRRPGCFALRWRARMEKSGGVFSYTPPVDNPLNPLSPNAFTTPLDGDMDDQLTGLTEICCCAWDLAVPVAQAGDQLGSEPEPSAEVPAGPELVDAPAFAAAYGVDWVATPMRSPDPQTWGDAETQWRGTYELKSCTWEFVQVVNPDGSRVTKRRKTRDYEPTNEANDADTQTIAE